MSTISAILIFFLMHTFLTLSCLIYPLNLPVIAFFEPTVIHHYLGLTTMNYYYFYYCFLFLWFKLVCGMIQWFFLFFLLLLWEFGILLFVGGVNLMVAVEMCLRLPESIFFFLNQILKSKLKKFFFKTWPNGQSHLENFYYIIITMFTFFYLYLNLFITLPVMCFVANFHVIDPRSL